MPVYGSHLADYEELRIGDRIRKERQRLGLTLRDVERRCRISTARLSQIENGHHVLDVSQAFAIADALGLPRNAFLPPDVSVPYQICRDGTVRLKPAQAVRLGASRGSAARPHHSRFWPLADLFVGRHLEAVLAEIMPSDAEPEFYSHHEQEFFFVLRGRVEFLMRTPEGTRREELARGDCIYLNSSAPHCIRALDGQSADTVHVLSSIGAGATSGSFAPQALNVDETSDGHPGNVRAIGHKLQFLREAMRLTPAHIGQLIGISEAHVEQIERGDRAIALDAIIRLARALGRPIREFVGDLGASGASYVIQRREAIASVPARSRLMSVDLPGGVVSHTFQPLASGFPARQMCPYFVRLLNVEAAAPKPHEHHGQEFIYVLDGEVELTTFAEAREVQETLRAGDSCYLDSSVPHLLRGRTRNPYSETVAEAIDVFWCPLGEGYLFDEPPD